MSLQRWTAQEDLVLETHCVDGIDTIMSLLPHRSYNSIKVRLSNKGLGQRDFWTDNDDGVLHNAWESGLTHDEIAAQMPKFTKKAIQHRLSKLGLVRKEYHKQTVDEEFFTDIETPAQAYLLGYFTSDGYITSAESKRWTVGFVSKDTHIVDLIKKEMLYDGAIYERKHSGCYELKINSKYMWEDLAALGYDHEKSYTAQYPNIPDHLASHFVRGVFDGDGCMSRQAKKSKATHEVYRQVLSWSMLGTEALLQGIWDRLPETVEFRNKKNQLYELRARDKKAERICEWMYKDSNNLRLERKYDRYIESLNQAGFYA